jgi:hypothetical protein
MGLPNMQKNADEIQIESEPGIRTRASMTFFLGSSE